MAPESKTTKVLIPSIDREMHFVHRDVMRSERPLSFFRSNKPWPVAQIPIDWYENLIFPIFGNDKYGICGGAMAAHGDQTFTGVNGNESDFDLNKLIAQYLSVSGGDRGLTEDMVINQIWKQGIAGNRDAIIYDAIDLNPDPASIASAIANYGVVCLGMSVPDRWISAFAWNGGAIWDGPANPNPRYGHYVLLNGVDAKGRFRVQTWGSWAWLTPLGLASCDPDAFTVFSPRWFHPKSGIDPTGASYEEKAALWIRLGGQKLPPSPFPPPAPPVPEPVAGPTYATLQAGGLKLTLWLDGTKPPSSAGKNPAKIQLGDKLINISAKPNK